MNPSVEHLRPEQLETADWPSDDKPRVNRRLTMRYWIFTVFGIAAILLGAYMLFLQWSALKPLLLIFLGIFLLLLGISLLSGPKIYMKVR